MLCKKYQVCLKEDNYIENTDKDVREILHNTDKMLILDGKKNIKKFLKK